MNRDEILWAITYLNLVLAEGKDSLWPDEVRTIESTLGILQRLVKK